MTEPLPRRTALARQIEDQPDERIPWDAFTVATDTAGMYGQPSPALVARARRGWRNLGALHARAEAAGEDSTAGAGPA
ncbi:hypothetical protein ACIGBH_40900 [Streptomyces sp. NPDC085929]|uniref:hypothetical protein n=1 Tax=Streptomyces sp. NPDC085929 TaxID=3365739 RepID=UPI0037D08DFC